MNLPRNSSASSLRRPTRQRVGVLLAATITAVVGCGTTSTTSDSPAARTTSGPSSMLSASASNPPAAPVTNASAGPSNTATETVFAEDDQSIRIRLTIGNQSATASLADNPTAQDFASLLPVTIAVSDLLGQEKTGDLPRDLDESGEAVFTYEIGQIGYWTPSGSIAILYAVHGDGMIPGPGLIPLGNLDAGLDVVTSADDGAVLTIEQLN